MIAVTCNAKQDGRFAVWPGYRYFCVSSGTHGIHLRRDSGIKRLYYGQFALKAKSHGWLKRGMDWKITCGQYGAQLLPHHDQFAGY
jgi:hypothetical protein